MKGKEIQMKFHPRAFSAFGSDLVTSDDVAITELVKNSYDAFANNVAVIFKTNELGEQHIEVIDDGLGMSPEIIETSWAVIATPYKKTHPYVIKNGVVRRVSGNKGLGRFSAARLGDSMQIITKSADNDCISASLDWKEFENAENIDKCKVLINDYSYEQFRAYLNGVLKSNPETGTIIRITKLKTRWTYKEINNLQMSLARLVSPFDEVNDFNIYLLNNNDDEQIVKVEPHDFIKHPLYKISGYVESDGSVTWKYEFAPKGAVAKSKSGTMSWQDAKEGFEKTPASLEDDSLEEYSCGPFDFEIRAWDLDSDSVTDVKDAFNIPKREIRQTIAKYKGISVYRDHVLVLPKSDASKDWLGVDIRRVSALGKRLSTSQIIGILSISLKNNPELKDTTDREKLVDTKEYKQFCKIVESIISTLENLRNVDRKDNKKFTKHTLVDLLAPLSAAKLESDIEKIIEQGKEPEDILDAVHSYKADSEKTLNELNDRLVYYAQTASLGSIAIIIMHEIRSGMNVMKRFLNRVKNNILQMDSRTQEYYNDAVNSHARLLEVANSFAPLYRKNLQSSHSTTSLLHSIDKSIKLVTANKEYKNILIKCEITQDFIVGMQTGELQTIIINLLDNACYWIHQCNNAGEVIIALGKINETTIEISISDNGPGINKEDAEKIFEPGITSKPQGIGMGLVIVTELLNNHNAKIRTVIPGYFGGATFIFDLPIVKE